MNVSIFVVSTFVHSIISIIIFKAKAKLTLKVREILSLVDWGYCELKTIVCIDESQVIDTITQYLTDTLKFVCSIKGFGFSAGLAEFLRLLQ